MIEIKDLHKSYKMGANSLHVLKGIDLNVTEGELVSIMGSFGSGKSTLLNILGMLDESEVEKIEEDLPFEITGRAIENTVFDATLDYLAPKGVTENGAIQFKIKGVLAQKEGEDTFIRAGLSANASIIL